MAQMFKSLELWYHRCSCSQEFGPRSTLIYVQKISSLIGLSTEKKHEAYTQTQNCQYHHRSSSHPLQGTMRTNENAEYKWEVICTRCCRRILSVYMGKVLRTKDETPEVIIKLIKQLLVRLKKSVRIIRSNNGTDFINKQLALFLQGTNVTMGGSNCYSLLHPKPTLDTYSSQQNSI